MKIACIKALFQKISLRELRGGGLAPPKTPPPQPLQPYQNLEISLWNLEILEKGPTKKS